MSTVPYPAELARSRTLADGRKVTIRPVRAEDARAERSFFDALSPEAKRMRFMKFVGAVSDELIHFFTDIDYDRRMAFVCEAGEGPAARIVGEARYAANPDTRSCEFGVVIADDWHKSGIAGLLMDELIHYARARRFETIDGLVLRENREMLKFTHALGFEAAAMPEDPTLMRVVKKL